jgi:hypothetical protein
MRRTATLLKTRPVAHQRLTTASAGLLKPSSAWAFLASRSYSSNGKSSALASQTPNA